MIDSGGPQNRAGSRRRDWLQLAILCDRIPRVGAALTTAVKEGQRLGAAFEEAQMDRGRRSRARAILRHWPAERVEEIVGRAGCCVAVPGETEYPSRLLDLDVPPAALFWCGERPDWEVEAVAIVGSRNASRAGCALAHGFASAAAESGVSVISGMAFGVDSAAHVGALDGGGVTVAVLAGGAECPSPRGMARVYERILDSGGVIVSEYPPCSVPRAYRFPIRNRIIAGLGDRLLVVEAGVRSGSLHTVDHALTLGRTVFSVPSDAGRATGRGSNQLIRDGAAVALDPADLFPEWQRPERAESQLTMNERKIMKLLQGGACPVNEVADRLGVPISTVLASMARLEARGLLEVRAGWAEPALVGPAMAGGR